MKKILNYNEEEFFFNHKVAFHPLISDAEVMKKRIRYVWGQLIPIRSKANALICLNARGNGRLERVSHCEVKGEVTTEIRM